LATVFATQAQVLPGALVTMRSGSRDDGRFQDLEAIARYHRQVRPAHRDFLAGLTLQDLDRALERSGRQAIPVAWAVGHIAEHESYHLGKCTLLRNLLPA
jgi:hypothetical protein